MFGSKIGGRRRLMVLQRWGGSSINRGYCVLGFLSLLVVSLCDRVAPCRAASVGMEGGSLNSPWVAQMCLEG